MSIKQWLKNFIGWVNDTMNMPAVAIWAVWEALSPKWSKAEAMFRDFKNTSKWVSDMWQNYQSAWYLLWRLAPWAAVYWAMPAIWAALPTAAVAWINTAWLWTISTLPELESYWKRWNMSTRWWYRTWKKRDTIKVMPANKKEPIKSNIIL